MSQPLPNLLKQLAAALLTQPPDSPVVLKLCERIAGTELEGAAKKLLDAWAEIRSQALPTDLPAAAAPSPVVGPTSTIAPPPPPPPDAPGGWRQYLPYLALLLGGGGAAGWVAYLEGAQGLLDRLHVTNPTALLGVIAAVGGLAGLVNSYFTNDGFVVPKATTKDGRFVLEPGFLGNLLIGAVAAVLTTASATLIQEQVVAPGEPSASSTPAEADPPSPQSAGDAAKPPRLTWGVLVSAAVAGWAGARLVTGLRDRQALLGNLIKIADRPKLPSVKLDQARKAVGVFATIRAATGEDPLRRK